MGPQMPHAGQTYVVPPSKFSDAAIQECLRNLRLGLPRRTAAALAGWSSSALDSYLTQGRAALAAGNPDDAKARFVVAVRRAEAEAKRAALAIIVRAAQGLDAVLDEQGRIVTPAKEGDWRAAAWLLERRWPEQYGPRRLLVGPDGPVEVRAEVTVAALEDQVRAAKERHLRSVPDDPLPPAG